MIKAEDVKSILTIDDIKKVVESLGGIKKSEDDKTCLYSSICHHKDAERHKSKLYLLKSTKILYCQSCSNSFDVFGLVKQRKELLGESISFPACIKYVCDICGIECEDIKETNGVSNKCNWQDCINRYNRYASKHNGNAIYDKEILNNLEDRYYQGWIDEGISIETQEKFGIKWYNFKQQIVIPIFDEDGNFIGGHVRNLNPIAIEEGYKYMPFTSLTQEYKFNTSNVLYGFNMNKENIRYTKTAIIFESPKSVLMYEDISEINNSVGLFGMNMQKFKRDLLMKYGCEHYIIALDRQYEKQYKEGNFCDEKGNEIKVKTDEYKKYLQMIHKIVKILKPYGKVEVILDNDKDRLLGYKDAPVDKGKCVWEKLYKNRKEWEDII